MSKSKSAGSGSANRRQSTTSQAQQAQRRKVVVFTSLVGVLTATSAMLMALAPAPLVPGAASLYAVDAPNSLDVIFNTRVPVAGVTSGPASGGRWKYIFIHHSRTPEGDAVTLGERLPGGVADHFVIGNGEGAADGEIQVSQRWNQQLPPAPSPEVRIDPDCISICLVGDFDRTVPTPMQLRRTSQLVATLQSKLGIGHDAVLLFDQAGTSGGIGKYFPVSAFREQLLP